MKKRIVAVTCVLMFCLGLIGCGTERADKTQQLIRGAAPGYNDGLIRVGMIQTGKRVWLERCQYQWLSEYVHQRKRLRSDLYRRQFQFGAPGKSHVRSDPAESRLYYPAAHRGDRMGGCHTCCRGAGIPVIVADRKIAVDETEYVSWIGSDFEEEGRKAVTWQWKSE